MNDHREPWLAAIGDEAASSLTGQIAAMTRLGWSQIELRSVNQRPVAQLAGGEVRYIAEALAEAGLSVCMLSSNIGAWGRSISTPVELDLSELAKLARHGELLGVRRVRVMSWQADDDTSAGHWAQASIRRMEVLVAKAEDLGLTLMHENCRGWAAQDHRRSLELISTIESPHLSLLLDIGNCVVHGHDPVVFTEALAAHVAHVHVKDVVWHQDGPRFVPLGEGQAHLDRCLTVLRDAGYSGGISLEPHLHTRPHDGVVAHTRQAVEDFVECGRTLSALVRRVWQGSAISL
jgi:L-ribulose-5-phosphate 3-epimerase